MNEINMTPFIDVMLVLLIIFMVAAPMMTRRRSPRSSADQGRAAEHGCKARDAFDSLDRAGVHG